MPQAYGLRTRRKAVHQLTYHLTVVRDIPLDAGIQIVGRVWLPGDADEVANAPSFLDDADFEERFEDQIEDKVVKPRGRRPRRPTEGVETK